MNYTIFCIKFNCIRKKNQKVSLKIHRFLGFKVGHGSSHVTMKYVYIYIITKKKGFIGFKDLWMWGIILQF